MREGGETDGRGCDRPYEADNDEHDDRHRRASSTRRARAVRLGLRDHWPLDVRQRAPGAYYFAFSSTSFFATANASSILEASFPPPEASVGDPPPPPPRTFAKGPKSSFACHPLA